MLRGRREGGAHSLGSAGPAPLASTSSKGRSAVLGTNTVVDAAIVHSNEISGEETGWETDDQNLEREDSTQLCDLSVEELTKRTRSALDKTERNKEEDGQRQLW